MKIENVKIIRVPEHPKADDAVTFKLFHAPTSTIAIEHGKAEEKNWAVRHRAIKKLEAALTEKYGDKYDASKL